MEDLRKRLSLSARELKRISVITVCAMFAALSIVLNTVATIRIGTYIRIGFSDIPNQFVDLLFGPVTGAIYGGALDIIKFMIAPDGQFFFGYTFSAMLAAFIYGLIYYRRPLTIWRVLLAKGLVSLLVNVILGTIWLDILYGDGFFVLLPARALKNLIMWPIDSVIFYVLAEAIQKTGILKGFLHRGSGNTEFYF